MAGCASPCSNHFQDNWSRFRSRPILMRKNKCDSHRNPQWFNTLNMQTLSRSRLYHVLKVKKVKHAHFFLICFIFNFPYDFFFACLALQWWKYDNSKLINFFSLLGHNKRPEHANLFVQNISGFFYRWNIESEIHRWGT